MKKSPITALIPLGIACLILSAQAHETAGLARADAATPSGQMPADLIEEDERQGGSPLASGPWWEWETATGDWLGLRSILLDHGVDVFGGFTTEVWGNPVGGLSQGAVSTNLLDFGVELDLAKLLGWQGATLHNSWLAPMGRDLSSEYVGNLFTVSNAAAFNSLYLYELWLQQTFLNEALSLRLGQLAADTEFAGSDYASLFLNATFGWPPFLSANIPNVGPAFPKGTLGVRLAAQPASWITLQTALYQGNPFADPDNRHGFRWKLNSREGYLWMNEVQARWQQDAEASGLPGQGKLGFWYHTADFSGTGAEPETYAGNYGFYAIIDQMLYRESTPPLSTTGKDGKAVISAHSDQGLGWFGRVAVNPQNRNFIGFYFDTGLTYKGLIPTLDNDTLGVAFAYGQLTRGARQDLFDEGSRGVCAEMVLEATYQCELTPWLTLQPDLQYIITPAATTTIPNALILGARASIAF